MGGDLGPRLSIAASLKFLQKHPQNSLTLVGDESQIKKNLLNYPLLGSQADAICIHHALDSITMDERPSTALRHKRDSSMALAVKMVADGDADACVSAGNTGAMMAFGLHLLRALPGIDRPAICKAMPTKEGPCFLLDLGANTECSADSLYQFAIMGASVARLSGIRVPRVGLINVGVEAYKGRDEQQQAAQRLAGVKEIEFVGFVEGGDIYQGSIDVAVCDGFTGNVLLKASEGAVELMQYSLKQIFRGFRGGVAGWIAKPFIRSWRNQYDPSRYNGASLLGLNGVVVKSHGGASEEGFVASLEVACEQVLAKVPNSISGLMRQQLG